MNGGIDIGIAVAAEIQEMKMQGNVEESRIEGEGRKPLAPAMEAVRRQDAPQIQGRKLDTLSINRAYGLCSVTLELTRLRCKSRYYGKSKKKACWTV